MIVYSVLNLLSVLCVKGSVPPIEISLEEVVVTPTGVDVSVLLCDFV